MLQEHMETGRRSYKDIAVNGFNIYGNNGFSVAGCS